MISLRRADYKFGKKFFSHFFRVKAVHCQYKNEYSYTFCGFYHVKHSDPLSVILSDRVQCQRKGDNVTMTGVLVCRKRKPVICVRSTNKKCGRIKICVIFVCFRTFPPTCGSNVAYSENKTCQNSFLPTNVPFIKHIKC